MSPGRRGQALFLSFSAAVFLAVYLLPVELWPWLGMCALAPAGLFLWKKRPLALLVCLGAAAGLLWCGAYRAVFFAPAQALDGRRAEVTLCLSESPTPSDYGACAVGWVLQEGRAPVQAALYGDETLLDLRPGDRARVLADCSQTALREESRFTARATRGIFLRLIARGEVTAERAAAAPWWSLPRRWGEALGRSMERALPADVSGFLKAMVTGDRSGVDGRLKTRLDRAGISHLMAVSGMHVCFLVSFLTLLTGHDPKKRAAVCVPTVLLFTLAVGCSPSVTRACCFQLAVLAADCLGRETERWTSLLGTLSVLLVFDPFSAAGVSLQLSFAAVAGIGMVTPRICAALSRRSPAGESRWARWAGRAWRYLAQMTATTLGALVFTAPLCAGYFGAVSLAAPVSNLLVLPVAGLLFVGGLVVGAVGLILPAPAALAGAALAPAGRYALGVAGWIARFPYSSLPAETLRDRTVLLVAYALLLAALLPLGGRRRTALLLCAGALTAGNAAQTAWSYRSAPFTGAVLDVGQGQSVLLASRGRAALVDCGGSGYTDPGDVCANYLNARGETRLDTLILTHYDADHRNGLAALFDRLEVGEVILPAVRRDEDTQLEILALAAGENARVTWLEEDGALTLGEMSLRLYAPLGAGGANAEGLSALVTAGEFRLLITGDMDTSVEERLVAEKALPRCQTLVAGHHGARDATGEALLRAVQPERVIISVGADNPYGHPAPETLERLERAGAEILRTDQLGSVPLSPRP